MAAGGRRRKETWAQTRTRHVDGVTMIVVWRPRAAASLAQVRRKYVILPPATQTVLKLPFGWRGITIRVAALFSWRRTAPPPSAARSKVAASRQLYPVAFVSVQDAEASTGNDQWTSWTPTVLLPAAPKKIEFRLEATAATFVGAASTKDRWQIGLVSVGRRSTTITRPRWPTMTSYAAQSPATPTTAGAEIVRRAMSTAAVEGGGGGCGRVTSVPDGHLRRPTVRRRHHAGDWTASWRRARLVRLRLKRCRQQCFRVSERC